MSVVSRLVGGFCATVEAQLVAVQGGAASAEEAGEEIDAQIRLMGRIFSGQDPEYQIVKGYNDVTLPAKLRGDLMQYLGRVREKWGDQMVCVLFDWLAALLAQHWRAAKGDDFLLETSFGPSVRYATAVLLGTEARSQS